MDSLFKECRLRIRNYERCNAEWRAVIDHAVHCKYFRVRKNGRVSAHMLLKPSGGRPQKAWYVRRARGNVIDSACSGCSEVHQGTHHEGRFAELFRGGIETIHDGQPRGKKSQLVQTADRLRPVAVRRETQRTSEKQTRV